MSILQAIIIAILYFLANGTIIGVGFFTLYRPLVMGFATGLILGDPVTGTIIGASINLIYIGHISAGGSLPGDPALAGIVGASLGITAGLDVNATLPIATSVGILGSLLWFGRLTLNSFFVRLADKYAAEGNASSWWVVNVGIPQALLFLITAVPGFVIVYFGANYIQGVLDFLGQHVLTALIVVGGMLPALGLALTLKFIFEGEARIYFLLGFLLVVFFELDMIGVGLFAAIIAIAYLQFKNSGIPDEESTGTISASSEDAIGVGGLSNSTLFRSYINWTFHAQGVYNYERMMGIGFAHSMVPAFREWYEEGSPEMAEALQRHTIFYNTSPQFGTIINGLVLAMEEQIYHDSEEITGESINAVKTSLMGPLSGIGDTLTQGVIVPLLLSFFIGMSLEGNLLGPILYSVSVVALIWGFAWWFFKLGYERGNEAIVNLLESGYINRLIAAAKVMGAIVIGALVASFVYLNIGISIPIGDGSSFVLQEQLFDAILPQLLPLLLTLGCYYLLEKGMSSSRVMFLLFVVGTLGGYFGIFVP